MTHVNRHLCLTTLLNSSHCWRSAMPSSPRSPSSATSSTWTSFGWKFVWPRPSSRLSVRGPTGCRYLADERQRVYVRDGWNLPGDTFLMDQDGYLFYQARSDDMIVSAGYNIAGPEVESSLMQHAAVADCGVVAAPDEERGMIVKAYVVLKPGHLPGEAMTRALQDHVKASIAPYKYPRAIEFVESLPRTETGKLQRFKLKQSP